MEAGSTLETIAEIAISITGFAEIVGALAGEKLSPAHPDIWLGFRAMISTGLSAVSVALFPFLPPTSVRQIKFRGPCRAPSWPSSFIKAPVGSSSAYIFSC